MKILSICGSLREASSNFLLLKTAQRDMPMHDWLYFDISTLPYFDPDNQYSANIPNSVLEARALATKADIIFIFTPEYARGIPGILKNALEWIFHEGTQKKPAYIVIGSAMGESTRAQLIEVMSTMDFTINETQIFLVKGARSIFNSDGTMKDNKLSQDFLQFCRSIRA